MAKQYHEINARIDKALPRLKPHQQVALKEFLDQVDNVGFGIYIELVRTTANAILAKAHTGNGSIPQVGYN
ncbi:hypothetical protein P154DRAFT_524543 [Amniculicola lignicola CBS 123094]|uniref:Uncharacterized protein n=1 Tax=Amniculicola lignicola CBS 123094 TaxID=1392246 RepID=A0A6A5WJI4_9PLEO|nr:hypothetical protein P154DRAFT_524543 [Amniculicola lignicola CBS 123094]